MPLTLPYVVGLDGAGVVDQVGDGVIRVRAGDEVFGYRLAGGTTAEYALLDGWVAKPAGRPPGSTSVRALDALGVGPGVTVLLDGASGGVGAIATQIAVARGATVLGTASDASQDFLASLGAIPLVYGPGLPDRIPPGVRVDAAIDVSGHGGVASLVAITGDPASVITLIDGSAAALGVRLSRFDPSADVVGHWLTARISLPAAFCGFVWSRRTRWRMGFWRTRRPRAVTPAANWSSPSAKSVARRASGL